MGNLLRGGEDFGNATPPAAAARTRERLRVAAVAAGLVVITLLLFAGVLGHEFLLYDDQQYVTENPHVLSGINGADWRWAWQAGYASNWHPLTWLSHQLDCSLFGVRAAGHHGMNLLFHAANTVLLLLVLRRLTGTLGRSAVVAALFAWHPLHVESVAWVAERKDVLCAFGWLLTLLAYARYVARPGVLNYLLVAGGCALALLAKPMAVTLPCVLLLLDYWPLGRLHPTVASWRRRLGEKLPLCGLSAITCVLTVRAQHQSHAIVSLAGLPLGERLGHVLVAYAHYLRAMVWPTELAVYYPYERPGGAAVLGAGALLAAITCLVVAQARRRPWWVAGWGWYVGTLVPVIGLVQVGDQAWADRYTYLPLIGLFLALVWEAGEASNRLSGSGRRVVIGATILMLTVLAGLTHRQIGVWQDTRTLFTQSLRVSSANSKALAMLGSLAAKDGHWDAAIERYQAALRVRADDPEAHFLLGVALEGQGDLAGAIREYRAALWFPALRAKTHFFLAGALAKQREWDAAATEYAAALEADPESAPAHNNLARVRHAQNQLAEAAAEYRRALALAPDLPEARNNLGIVLLQSGQATAGIAELRAALRQAPTNAETQYNLAVALNEQGRWAEALEYLGPAAASHAKDPNAHYQFARALAGVGRPREALPKLARALLLRPDFPEALDELAWLLATSPQNDLRNGVEAVPMAERACELTQGGTWRQRLTLAAAYAEAGRWNEAVAAAERVQASLVSTAPPTAQQLCARLLTEFRAGRPWREPTVNASQNSK